ncbi:unnamed protein product [Allacma fusca]|uniref:acylphosphatase n=1 Tax=Allacma fusca TaxID=39272 RepID=A0A8J2JQQ6_9HEXA|nr:unnamed protein product [Allacma fusca]
MEWVLNLSANNGSILNKLNHQALSEQSVTPKIPVDNNPTTITPGRSLFRLNSSICAINKQVYRKGKRLFPKSIFLEQLFCSGVRLSRSRAMASSGSTDAKTNLVSVDFEIFGKVQGVFFRKYTKAKGSMLNLRGWCENTERGTVIGQIEGPREKVAEMKNWLKTEGSPKSRISHCNFSNEQKIEKHNFNDFNIRK